MVLDKYTVIASSIPFVFGIAWFFFGKKDKKVEEVNNVSPEKTKIIELNISGMHCAGCAAGIEGTLKSAEGIIEAKVNFATSKGLFKYDPSKITKEQIIERIGQLGYSATQSIEEIEKKSS